MQVVAAAALYCAVVFGVGFVLGPIRVFWLEPSLGKTAAVFCEMPLLLTAMILAARWVPAKVGLRTDLWSLAAMGVGALVFQQIADFAVGVFLRGLSPGEQTANFRTPAGIGYAIALVVFAAMPLLVNGKRTKH